MRARPASSPSSSLRRGGIRPCAATALAGLLLGPIAAAASPLDAVNAVRQSGCGREPLPPLARSAQLDAVAERVARGAKLRDALPAMRYRANEAVLLHVTAVLDERTLRRMLQQEYCEDLWNAAVKEGGFARVRGQLWLVFAAPFEPPPVADAAQIAHRALELVNQARATPQACGDRPFGAAGPLRLSQALNEAALAHSREMAAGAPFAHESPTTGSPRQRVDRTGYRAAIVGENIAAGWEDVEGVVGSWMNSPGHCANIMDPRYAEMGIAYEAQPRTRQNIYWTQVFAAPAGG